MKTLSREVVFVLGAGFSSYAGLPLQDQFTEALLAADSSKPSSEKTLVEFLREFVHDVFDHGRTASAQYWPALEDIFTCIDLSANTGHHLGAKYSPSLLRTVRRALVARVNEMLWEHYRQAAKREGPKWEKLQRFFKTIDPDRSAFINMNWDAVVEDQLRAVLNIRRIEYGCTAYAADLPDDGERVRCLRLGMGPVVPVIKVHGSTNWLYCDNCRRLFWFPPGEGSKLARQTLTDDEWCKIEASVSKVSAHSQEDYQSSNWTCSYCPEVRLGGRLATFSYRKALDFPMFQKSWFAAEKLLGSAKTWFFIGYSLPAADFEFKYLLKRIQASRGSNKPEFVLVTGGDKEAARTTYRNYQRFFGRGISKSNLFRDGLDNTVYSLIEHS